MHRRSKTHTRGALRVCCHPSAGAAATTAAEPSQGPHPLPRTWSKQTLLNTLHPHSAIFCSSICARSHAAKPAALGSVRAPATRTDVPCSTPAVPPPDHHSTLPPSSRMLSSRDSTTCCQHAGSTFVRASDMCRQDRWMFNSKRMENRCGGGRRRRRRRACQRLASARRQRQLAHAVLRLSSQTAGDCASALCAVIAESWRFRRPPPFQNPPS